MSATFSTTTTSIATHSCGCFGPQNGEPRCPCAMRGVQIKDGRYVMPERDLGPVCEPSSLVPDRNSASGFCVSFGRFKP